MTWLKKAETTCSSCGNPLLGGNGCEACGYQPGQGMGYAGSAWADPDTGRCDICGGSGRVMCGATDSGVDLPSTCDGRVGTDCARCMGDGEVDCPGCGEGSAL